MSEFDTPLYRWIDRVCMILGGALVGVLACLLALAMEPNAAGWAALAAWAQVAVIGLSAWIALRQFQEYREARRQDRLRAAHTAAAMVYEPLHALVQLARRIKQIADVADLHVGLPLHRLHTALDTLLSRDAGGVHDSLKTAIHAFCEGFDVSDRQAVVGVLNRLQSVQTIIQQHVDQVGGVNMYSPQLDTVRFMENILEVAEPARARIQELRREAEAPSGDELAAPEN